jgi:Na+/phosphate symporter
MITAIFPIVFMLAGAAVYVFAANPKLQELGKMLFAAGAFALSFALAGRTFAL